MTIPVYADLSRSGVPVFAAERARRLLNGAVLAFNNNVRTRGVISSGAPTITVGTGSAPSLHTRVYTFGDAAHPFVSSGGRPTTGSGRTTFPVVTPSSTRIDFCWRVETVVDSDSVAFLLDSVTADGYRFIVDGQYVSMTSTVSAAGSQRYYQLSWGSKARRRVVVEGNIGLGFWGSAVPDDGQCILPPDRDGSPRMFYVGDSNPYMQGFNQKGDNCGLALGDFLGIRDTWVNAISSTGFVVAGGGNNYGGRRADWTTLAVDSVDLFVFQLSYNDYNSGIPDATLQAAVTAELVAARAAHPNSIIIVHGNNSWNDFAGSTAGLTAHEVAAAAAVTAFADPLVVFLPIYSATGQTLPITGQSAAGDTGTGNTSRYVSHAADHMSPAGNIYFGEWLARRFIPLLAEIAGVPVPTPLPASAGGGGGTGPAGEDAIPVHVGASPPVTPVEGQLWLDTSAQMGNADFWESNHFGSNGAAAQNLFAGAAISSGTNNTAIPVAAVLGYNPNGVFIRSGTTANGGYRYLTSSLVSMRFGSVAWKFRGHYLARTSFTNVLLRLGFHDTSTSADATDGAYFELNGAVCSAKTANNSTRTTNATTVTLTLNTFYTFDIEANAAGTSVRFRVYEGLNATPILDVTNTTNIPTAAGREFGVGCVATESTTTATDIGILYRMGYGTVPAYRRAVMGS